MLKVEKGIEMPITKNKHPETKYPFETMEIGDSFFSPTDYIPNERSRIYAAARRFQIVSKKDWLFTSKAINEKGERGVRVWRTH